MQIYISKEEYEFWTADDPEPKPPLMPLDFFNTVAFYAKQALMLVRCVREVINAFVYTIMHVKQAT